MYILFIDIFILIVCIYTGQFVMEYVGEVIDHAEVQRRMTSQRELTPLVGA